MAVGRCGAAQRRLEERLRLDISWLGSGAWGGQSRAPAAASGETLNPAAQLQYDILIGLSELLAALRHHVRNGVKVDGLVLVGDSAPDVANLQYDLARQLTLNRQIDRINLIGTEIWIQGRGGGR